MKILLTSVGSAGDIHPFVELGKSLKSRGHQVILIVSSYFKTLVKRNGLSLMPLGTREDFQSALDNPDIWHPRKGLAVVMRQGVIPAIQPVYESIASQFSEDEETIVVGSSLAFGARIAQEKLGVPLVTLHLQPAIFRSVYETPLLGRLVIPAWTPRVIKKWIYDIGDAMVIDRILGKAVNTFRATLGLPAVRSFLGQWIHSPDRVIGLFPDWYAAPQPDWPANARVTGFIHFDETGQAETIKELQQFLDAGEPPIVFTAGTAMKHGKAFFETSVQAVQKINRRAILLTRYDEHLPPHLPENIRHFKYIPFNKILKHTALLVHHGGIGTTAQALAAGIPQLIRPMSHDQPDNAARLQRLGVGMGIANSKYQTALVAETLEQLLNSADVRRKTRQLAKKVDFETALAETCRLIEAAGMFDNISRKPARIDE